MSRLEATVDTILGPVSIARSPLGVTRIKMHGSGKGLSAVSSQHSAKGERPELLNDLVGRIGAHFAGEPQDFSDIPLALDRAGPFARTVYDELRKVPAGQTVTYGELAARTGRPGAARAVARAMATNRVPIVIPCHRVLGAGGKLTGFSGADGIKTKCQMLVAEGAAAPVLPRDQPLFDSLFEPYAHAAGVGHLARTDSLFGRLYEAVGDSMHPQQFPGNPFAALVESVCYQQLAGSAAVTIFRRVKKLVGEEPSPASVISAGFDGLRAAGMSTSKANTALALAELFTRTTAPSTDELLSLKGVGPWTIQMFSLFHLGLPDIFPPADLGVRKAVTALTGAKKLLSPERVKSIGRRWKPYRSIATWYLWRSLGTVTLGET